MLANTPAGEAYTLSELRQACTDSGFVATKRVQLSKAKRGWLPNGGWHPTLLVAYPQKPKASPKEGKLGDGEGGRGTGGVS